MMRPSRLSRFRLRGEDAAIRSLLPLALVAVSVASARTSSAGGTRSGSGFDSPCDGRGSGSIDVTLQVKPNGVVELQQFGGSVRVTTWAQSNVHLKGTFAPDCHVDISPSGEREELHLSCSHGPGVGDLELEIPQTSSLDVRGMSTDVEAHDVGGSVHVQTVSGDIEVKGGAPSEIEVRSISGDIAIATASAATRVQSVSGDVAVSGARGRATVRTVSGDCALGGGEFSAIEIETVSGDVTFRGALNGQGRFEMNSHSGDITLHLPRTTGADVEMRSTSGDLIIDMGSGRKVADRELDARIGPGGSKVRLRSFSGDVKVIE
jgi:DUF4097 and DUF4098 domain-containing protein YvlB